MPSALRPSTYLIARQFCASRRLERGSRCASSELLEFEMGGAADGTSVPDGDGGGRRSGLLARAAFEHPRRMALLARRERL